MFGLTGLDESSVKILRGASPIEYTKPGLPPFLLVPGESTGAMVKLTGPGRSKHGEDRRA